MRAFKVMTLQADLRPHFLKVSKPSRDLIKMHLSKNQKLEMTEYRVFKGLKMKTTRGKLWKGLVVNLQTRRDITAKLIL